MSTTPGPIELAEEFVSIAQLRGLAKERLASDVFDYIDSGACDEVTLRSNRKDLGAIVLRPFCLRPVETIFTTTLLFGHTFDAPIGFSPTAFQRLVHDDGELATAEVAGGMNFPMVLSCMSTYPLEEVAVASGQAPLWLQVYIFKDRGVTHELIRRAEGSGFGAVVLTAGTPVPGRRDRNLRNRFQLPQNVRPAHFAVGPHVSDNNPIHAFAGAELDANVSWHDVADLAKFTRLPVIVKGVLNPSDVHPALESGAGGIMVSNHGGRQLDSTLSSIRALPPVRDAVGGRVPLLVDSGYQRGTDILKALTLGADAVFLGRPVLWALCLGGAPMLRQAMELLSEELSLALKLVGVPDARHLHTLADQILSARTTDGTHF